MYPKFIAIDSILPAQSQGVSEQLVNEIYLSEAGIDPAYQSPVVVVEVPSIDGLPTDLLIDGTHRLKSRSLREQAETPAILIESDEDFYNHTPELAEFYESLTGIRLWYVLQGAKHLKEANIRTITDIPLRSMSRIKQFL